MNAPLTITASLAAITGPEHLRTLGVATAVAPGNTDEVAAILRFAQENHFAVVPWGGGTKQRWGYPVAPAMILETHRLSAIREHTWQDMTCAVEAGCTWAALQSALAQHGQYVALDPLCAERATVGGIVATNDSGALRLRYGSLRDLIIGMTIVLADGTIAKTGGKVVKNVAGYDLHKLMTGAFGTLGVITSVNFRLHPVEQHSRTWTAIAPHPSVFDVPLRSLLDSQMTASCVQLRVSQRQSALDVRIAGLPHCMDESGVRLKS